MRRICIAIALLAACTKVPGTEDDRDRQGVRAPDPETPPAPRVTVTLTSVTFGDDCGGTPPTGAPANAPAQAARTVPSYAPTRVDQEPRDVAPGYAHRCMQTSMQLSIAAKDGSIVAIKRVEVFDEKGVSLGVLASSKPTHWSVANGAYEPWDEKVVASQTELVSYVLSQPGFVNPYEGHDRMYTVKVIASVGGADQGLQTTVMVAARPPPMPT